ncbi:alpha/beta hydrolase [Amycolatopsis antarctica]|uniref:Alpha/beta hydrolase n=1 Tax=Amycolatopsis antarctica TaxID=1854586 RepID=A0A263D6E3_9PSEU|nr:alpha/beta fold hydrolase [Amycolatopsis antarctica]OZM73036.1 alpha/beta hydrolase [Amycolatopsis antarctica]
MPATPSAGFASPDRESAFRAAYERVLSRWGVTVERADLRSEFGTTRVNTCGPADAPPLLLLHGGGATSTVWHANAAALAARHRVYAVDQLGDAGLGKADGRPIAHRADLAHWLESVLDGLGVASAAFAGHSHGAWTALMYALAEPNRVDRLVLLDPTRCFAGFAARYLLHAVPVLARPTPARFAAFLRWETRGAALPADWVHLATLAATEFRRGPVVAAKRPGVAALRGLAMPTTVVVAGHSRCHDADRVAAVAAGLSSVRVETVAGVSHHELPAGHATEVNRLILDALA